MNEPVRSLSNPDLLAALVGRRTAMQMLKRSEGSLEKLFNCTLFAFDAQERAQAKLGVAKELVRRSMAEILSERSVLNSPAAVRDYLRLTLASRDYEVFLVIFLDAQNRVIAATEMFRGTLTQTSVYPREVVKQSLVNNAGAVILAHNHPSGIAEPSHADELLTRTLKQALSLIDVKVLDHFIVAGNAAMSFAESGLL